jgi:cell division protein FtsL
MQNFFVYVATGHMSLRISSEHTNLSIEETNLSIEETNLSIEDNNTGIPASINSVWYWTEIC